MSPVFRDMSILASVLKKGGWADIDELFDACFAANAFSHEFLSGAIKKAAKAEIRRQLKSGKVRDENGNVIRVANIVVKGKEGKLRRVYKQEMLFDVGDCVQVVSYWNTYVKRGKKKRDYYVNLAVQLHGPQIQGMLPLGDE
jgi:hypothetical protein